MSIIYEALKKIETQKPSFSGKQPPASPGMFSPAVHSSDVPTLTRLVSAKPRQRLFLKSAIAVGVLVLVSGAGIFFALRSGSPPLSSAPASSSPQASLVSARYKSQDFILEGIVYDEKVPLAIINGTVYRHYERLGDYMIIDIAKKEVTLRNLDNDSLLHLALPF